MELSTQDYIDIQQLYARYTHACDLGDVDGWIACFTEDGALNATKGHAALRTMATAAMKNQEETNTKGRHWNANLIIDPAEGGAVGRCYLMFVRIGAENGWG